MKVLSGKGTCFVCRFVIRKCNCVCTMTAHCFVLYCVFSVGIFGCYRTYGRASRQLHVATNFVPFNPDIIPRFDEWALVARPFLHIYWTCCVRKIMNCKI